MAATADLVIKLSADSRGVEQTLRNLQSSLAGLAGAPVRGLGAIADGLGKIGLASIGVGAIGDSLKGLGSFVGLGLANELEQTSARFQAFTKDAGKTQEILAMVRKEADQTPFEFKEMASAAASLMPVAKAANVPLMDLVKTAEVLAASNPAQGLEGAAVALREFVAGGDITSLAERFDIPRQRLNQLKAQGIPALEAVKLAMSEMGLDADLVANKANILQGRWSTFMDTIDGLKMRISQPIFEALKDGLEGLQSLFESNKDAITGFADGVATTVSRVIGAVKSLANVLSGGDAWDLLAENLDNLFGPAVTDRILGPLMKLVPAIQRGARTIADAWGTVVQVFQQDWEPSAEIDSTVNAVGQLAIVLRDQVLPAAFSFFGYIVDTAIPAVLNFAGQLEGPLKTALGFLKDTAFPLLTSAISAMSTAVSNATKFVQEHSPVQAALAGVVGAVTAAIVLHNGVLAAHAIASGVSTAATTAWTAAQWLLNAALTANPIGIVIVAVAGLTAGMIQLYNSNEDFRRLVDTQVVPTLRTLGALVGTVATAVTSLTDRFTASSGALSTLIEVVKALNPPLRLTLDMLRKIDELRGSAGAAAASFDTSNPDDFGRAHGGPVMAGTPYLVGERGPELFLPKQSGRIVPNDQLPAAGPTFNITVVSEPGADDSDRVRRIVSLYRFEVEKQLGDLAMSGGY